MNGSWFELLSHHPIVTCLGWALAHFIWQATAVALVVACLLGLAKRCAPQTRYVIASVGMLCLVIAPIVTFSMSYGSVRTAPGASLAETTTAVEIDNNDLEIKSDTAPEFGNEFLVNTSTPSSGDEVATTVLQHQHWLDQTIVFIRSGMPFYVAAWMLCVCLMGIRLVIGFDRVQRWRREASQVDDSELNRVFRQLVDAMSVQVHVRLMESVRCQVPAVIGWLRPMVIVPASLVSGLTTHELESILAHELAHVRRNDYLVNALQNVVETVLFYHPAVWWISSQIRVEREHCCDDIAVSVSGDRVALIKALARMEAIRCEDPSFALAANGGSLVTRLRRLSGNQPKSKPTWAPAGWLALGVVLILGGAIAVPTVWASPSVVDARHLANARTVGPDAPTEGLDQDASKVDSEITHKHEFTKTDPKTGIKKRVFTDIRLVAGRSESTASVDMMYSNVMAYTFLPARVAKQLGAVELGTIDFGMSPKKSQQAALEAALFPQEFPGHLEKTDINSPKQESKYVHELTKPIGDGRVVPYDNGVIWVPGHLGFYGMNQIEQQVFTIVRIEKIDLGIGSSFGPINALVLDDRNSEFGVLGRDWVQQVRGKNGETIWHIAADGSFRLMRPRARLVSELDGQVETNISRDESRIDESDETQTPGEKEVKQASTDQLLPMVSVFDGRVIRPKIRKFEPFVFDPRPEPLATVELETRKAPIPPLAEDNLPEIKSASDSSIGLKRAYINATKGGRSATEMMNHFNQWNRLGNGLGHIKMTGRVTNMETIVSAHPRYLLDVGMDADEMIFNLPEGSGMRAVFTGKNVSITTNKENTKVVVAEGKVELLDAGGVTRATASADGGADQVVVECRMERGEVVMTLRARRSKPDKDYPNPPMQVRMNLKTGAPEDEKDPPHGAIRYSIFPEDKAKEKPARMKMQWHYDMKRLAEDAEAEAHEKAKHQDSKRGDSGGSSRPQDHSDKSSESTLDTSIKTAANDDKKTAPRLPWKAIGRVTDAQGDPIQGATIRAHCGMGTLRQSGSATSGPDGQYELRFGPGMWSNNPKLVQAATISVQLDGHFERNLHRQGDLIAAFEKPDGEVGWGKQIGDLFLPGQAKTIDFVMVPSTSLRGAIIHNGKPASGYRVSMTGDDLPPSSSVIANGKTNEKGEFEFKDLPTGYKFQFKVEPPEAKSPWLAWASAPITFTHGETGDTHFEYVVDGKPVDFSCQRFQILIQGEGVNWKKALKDAAEEALSIQFNGLSTEGRIRAAEASIELGR